MAQYQSPKIITNGLVFYFDMNNIKKSNIGRPTTNLISNGDFSNDTTGWSNYALSTAPFVTDAIDVTSTLSTKRKVLQCNTLATMHGGGNYGGVSWSSPALTAGVTYTISFYARSSSGSMQLILSHQNGSGDNSNLYFSSTIGSSWTRCVRTATLDVQKNNLYIWNQSVSNGIFQIADIQLEAQSTATNFTSSSRSSSQAILDLTRNNNITADSLTYNSDGTFSFNGAGNYVSLPSTLGYTTTVSAFAWIKTIGAPKGGYHIVFGGQELEISIPTAGEIRTGVYTNARFVSNHGSGLTDGNWHYVGFTFDGSTKTSYIDGKSVGTQSITGTLTSTVSGRSMGIFGQGDTTYGMNGYISVATIYSTALSASEVYQNFNALRSRYGL